MKTVAYLSPFVPAEWIAAHGFRPDYLRLSAKAGQPSLAVTRGICPYAGTLIDAALSGIDASALVLTTICDQMRYAAAMVESRGSCPVFLLNVPSTWQTSAAARLYLDELRRLGQFLVQLGGKSPTNDELARMMQQHDRERNQQNSRRLTPAGQAASAEASPVPLALLGGPLLESDTALFDLIESAGGRVVLDATEGGRRTMPRPLDPARVAIDPLAELADAYFGSIPDAFRRPNTALYQWLARELSANQVRGIIFRRYVWCDLWHGELHRMKEWSGLPVLEVDVGPDDLSAPNRVQGRIEAFLETLRGAAGNVRVP